MKAALVALAGLALLSRRSSAPKQNPAPAAEKPASSSVVDAVAAAAPVVSAVVGAGKAAGSAVVSAVGAAAAGIAGVSAGFVIVGSLWAVALVAGIVAGKVLAPEMDRRKTMPAWLTSEPWGLAWRSAREFWLSAMLTKLSGFERRSCRWVNGDGRYGDLNVQGEITFLVGGETAPPADRFAFYDWLAWARARYTYPRENSNEKTIRDVENSAHVLARVYGRAFLITSRAIAAATGVIGADDGSTLAPLTPENTLPIGAGSLTPPMSAPIGSLQDVFGAIAEGVAAGTGVARVMYGPGGEWLLRGASRSRVALEVATALRAAGFAVSTEGPAVVFGTFGRKDMPGGVE